MTAVDDPRPISAVHAKTAIGTAISAANTRHGAFRLFVNASVKRGVGSGVGGTVGSVGLVDGANVGGGGKMVILTMAIFDVLLMSLI